jgi:methylmalonyl-CoA carboxyltransferase large subunit
MDLDKLLETLEGLRTELTRLGDRVAALEQANGKVAGAERSGAPVGLTGASPAAQPRPPAEEISEEIVLVIAAAVAAFLGKRAPIRQIRLVGSPAWAQQGRVTIQASHTR